MLAKSPIIFNLVWEHIAILMWTSLSWQGCLKHIYGALTTLDDLGNVFILATFLLLVESCCTGWIRLVALINTSLWFEKKLFCMFPNMQPQFKEAVHTIELKYDFFFLFKQAVVLVFITKWNFHVFTIFIFHFSHFLFSYLSSHTQQDSHDLPWMGNFWSYSVATAN